MDVVASPSARSSTSKRPAVKLRTLRKGTHSCLECKRRKMRCEFSSTSSCVGCKKRGSLCVSQHVVQGPDVPTNLDPVIHEPRQQTPDVMLSSNPLERLSSLLYKSLPPEEDTRRIWEATPHSGSLLAHELMTMPYTVFNQRDGEDEDHLRLMPRSTAHPVLIARHMLLLASSLQHLHLDLHYEIKGLSELPRVTSARLSKLAHDAVTSKDDLLGSIEGLECIMIESVYYANLGDLKRSWLTNRRAVNIAQLMGLCRMDGLAKCETLDCTRANNPKQVWSRIIFLDRFLCLLLGFPQACNAANMNTRAILTADIPMERLERIHCMVAARILERHESEPSAHDISFTRTLDLELQQAARHLPSQWWVVPTLNVTRKNPKSLSRDTGRLFAQVLHYNLLNQLHLPYMLASVATNEYSRATCVSASREMVLRYLALRSFNPISSSCRIIEFLALMAAITLLIAHLDGRSASSLLAHHYHSDRAMIEQVQQQIEEFQDVVTLLTVQSNRLLQRMLAIDVDDDTCSSRITIQRTGPDACVPNALDEGYVSSAYLPYFGIIRILRDGSGADQHSQSSTLVESAYGVGDALAMPTNVHEESQVPRVSAGMNHSSRMSLSSDFDLISCPLPPTPALDDWALQNPDMTFFEKFVGATGDEWAMR